MQFVGAIYPALELKNTNWSRPHWFYTLFTCVAHALVPIGGLEQAPRPIIDKSTILGWRGELDEISARYDEYTQDNDLDVPAVFARFINFAQRRTTDTEARVERAKFVLTALQK